MPYLLLGLGALAVVLVLARAYTTANPRVLARQLTVIAGVVALGGAAVLVARGAFGYAVSLAALGSWLLWGTGGGTPWGSPDAAPGRSSRVETEHLEVELDLDSGAIRGRVRKGFFAGRDLESLAPVEMAHLWQDCRFADPQSAQILEAYLDRVHPTWREDMARADGAHAAGPDGGMTREEALEILGLEPGASEDDIRRAHRELMLKMHPDRGGSTFLAAKINEAKEVLLK
jgi:hypothetical protein